MVKKQINVKEVPDLSKIIPKKVISQDKSILKNLYG